jgi:hypothetical protein
MPLMAALKTICFHVPGWRVWANLMDTRSAPEGAGVFSEDDLQDTQLIPASEVEKARTERVDKRG